MSTEADNVGAAAVRGAQGQPAASDEVAALTARLAAVERELERTRQHFRTRHGIGCAFTDESVAVPADFGEELADGG